MAKFPIETVAKLILPLLAVAGYICTHGVAARTGYWTLVTSQVRESRLLPGTKAPLKLRYIGITRVDNFLAALATVFWPLVDGSYAHASLQAFQFVGQLVALWTVLEIEARRFGNSWRLISFLPIWGIFMQAIGFTVIGPIYLWLHLLTSPINFNSSERKISTLTTGLLASTSDLRAFPLSITLGFVVPWILMCLPSPTFTSFETHQIWMSIWQVFPLSVAFFQATLSKLFSVIYPAKSNYHLAAERNAHLISQLRRVYLFAFTFSSVTHIAAWTLSISSILFPALFSPTILPYLHPRRCFLPPSPTSSEPTPNLGEGFLSFLLYDEYIGSLATLIWALVVNRNIHAGNITWEGWFSRLAKVIGVLVLAGPASAVVLLVWERDELVFAAVDDDESKKVA